jgi:hypothetical protein
MKFDTRYLMSVTLRALALGTIVFASVTYIPKNQVEMRNKVAISVAVVILYALLDYVTNFLVNVRHYTCGLLCNCYPPSTDVSLDLPDAAETDIKDIGLDDIDLS